MRLNPLKRFLIGTLAVTGLFWLVVSADAQPGKKLAVFVSIAPQKYFVQQVGRERVDVEVMVPSGADAHIYEPKPRQMVALSKADLYFAVGLQPFEKTWLKKISASHPKMRIVHTDQGIEKIPMEAYHSEADGIQGRENKYDTKGGRGADIKPPESGELDPHIWLSPPLVKIQAHTILKALQKMDPAHRVEYEMNYQAFDSELTALDADFKNIFAGKQGLQFMVLHPAWGYFARAYGLKQVPVEIEGKAPKPARLKELIELARAKNIKIIFAQPQLSPKSAELLATEIGGKVIFADPLALDWMQNLREVAQKFRAALQ